MVEEALHKIAPTITLWSEKSVSCRVSGMVCRQSAAYLEGRKVGLRLLQHVVAIYASPPFLHVCTARVSTLPAKEVCAVTFPRATEAAQVQGRQHHKSENDKHTE